MKIPTELMKQDMKNMSFVNWDRFIVNKEKKSVSIYGWIKREDTHEDFVILDYNNKGKNKWVTSYNTSSAKYDKRISEIVECIGEINPCQRVENHFEIENMIRLEKILPADTLTPSQERGT